MSRFTTMVRSVGARHRLSEADLDEVVQDVRIRLWKSCPTSEHIRQLGTSYVYRTATSAALDLLRRRRSHGADRTESVDAIADTLADPGVSAGITLDAESRRVARGGSRRTLPERWPDGHYAMADRQPAAHC